MESVARINISKSLIFKFSLIFIINAIVATNPIGIVFVVFQYLYVFYFVIRNDMQKAVFWHMIFMITSNSVLSFIATQVDSVYNYFSIKLVGPVTFSYIFSFFLLIVSSRNIYMQMDNSNIFLRMRKYFYIMGALGIIMGIVGVFFLDYFIEKFIDYTLYISVIIIHIELLCRNNKGKLLKMCFNACLPLLIAAVVGNIFNVLYGMQVAYGENDLFLQNAISSFVVLAILALPMVKNKVLVSVTVVTSLLMTVMIGSSGKFFINLSLVGVAFFLRLLSNKQVKHKSIVWIVSVVVLILTSSAPIEFEGLTSSKLHQFRSLENVIYGDISNIDRSPYIRVASIMNIYKENLQNPIYFVTGRGFGGYFQDDLHVLRLVDLGHGGFNDEYVLKNKFPTAHSTYAIVPLLNGFGGFALIIYLIVLYTKRGIRHNYLGIMGLLWLLNMFYYNILIGLVGVFFLYSSEFKLDHGYVKK